MAELMAQQRVRVSVHAPDPISQAGIATVVRSCPGIWLVDEGNGENRQVAVLVSDAVDEEVLQRSRAVRRSGRARVVLVLTSLDDRAMLAAVASGVHAIVPRSDATPDRIREVVIAAAEGAGALPPDLLGRLLDEIARMHEDVLVPAGLGYSGLTEREVSVLRLVAEGHDTYEIAGRLCYSERTIKNVLHDVTARLNLKNRTHAVAYAVRKGLI
ncbi:MAG: response regulator transcription factor [Actinomycetota bacterium]